MKQAVHKLNRNVSDYPKYLIPKDLPADALWTVSAMNRARDRLLVCWFRYECLRAMDRVFETKLTRTPTEAPMKIVKSSLITNVTINLLAVYDDDTKSVNLLRIAKALLHPNNLLILEIHHRSLLLPNTPLINFERIVEKTIRMQRRLKSSRLSGAIMRLKSLRDKELAHTDLDASLPHPMPTQFDVNTLFAFTANFFAIIESLLFGIEGSYGSLRHKPKGQAQRLIASIVPLARPEH